MVGNVVSKLFVLQLRFVMLMKTAMLIIVDLSQNVRSEGRTIVTVPNPL